jgi:hypothetical protein
VIRPGRDFLPGPLFLLIHLTLDCNCRYVACYQRHDNFYLTRRGKFLDFEQFKKILEETGCFFIHAVNIWQ